MEFDKLRTLGYTAMQASAKYSITVMDLEILINADPRENEILYYSNPPVTTP